jgi:hypothetical protein
MVTFTSLFLWLMTGVHPVEVAVDPVVVSVEIFLDGESIGVATEPEWELECDFGARLRPHELVAVARDAADREVGRAVQFVNLPRADAEVEIIFEGGSPDAPTMLRVITESAERLEPLAVFVTFDGVMLRQDGDGRYQLPAYDHRQVHIVSAEGRFPEGVTARRDLTFGGVYGGRVATELTAVPVIVDEKRALAAGELQGLFSARGDTLRVAAVEREGGRVYFVRDHGVWPKMRSAGRVIDRRDRAARGISNREVFRVLQETRFVGEIPPERDRFYLVVPNPTPSRGLSLFPVLHPFDVERWGMPWLTTHIVSQQAAVPGQRLAEAVALAGLRAAADGCPRVVVLVVGDDAVDYSWYRPDAVREYLRTLRVPLAVWSTAGNGSAGLWGVAETATGLGSIDKASRRLLKSLRRQWIVWVEGRHPPYEIELAENDEGIRLAG